MLRAYALFVLAGLAEIGGGYLVWMWLRNGKPIWVGAAICLIGVTVMLLGPK